MSDLAQLSHAATEALRDAEAHGANVAAHFLRVQIHEVFRELRHRPTGQTCADCEYNPSTAETNRYHNGG